MRKLLFCFFILSSLFLGGCFNKAVKHGYINTDIKIANGTSKREVLSLMGEPSFSLSQSDVWYYIESTVYKDVLGLSRSYSAKILEVHFNKNDLVSNTKFHSLPKQRVINPEPRTTIMHKETLIQKTITALKNLNPSL